MTDHEDPSVDTDFSDDFGDPAYDGIRGLLADARVDSPVPADVAARLDATLADLTADRRTATAPVSDALADNLVDNVVPLRRRSRLAPRLLVAAAAVVLVGAGGVGLNEVMKNSSGPASKVTTADAGSAPEASSDSPEMAPQHPVPNTPGAGTDSYFADSATGAGAWGPGFSSAKFGAQVDSYVAANLSGQLEAGPGSDPTVTGGSPSVGDTPVPTPTAPTPLTRTTKDLDQLNAEQKNYAAKACPGPANPDGEVFRILLDGKPAALVVGPLTEGSRLVRAWSCDGSVVLAAASVDH